MNEIDIKIKLNKVFKEMISSAAGLPGIEGLHDAKEKKKRTSQDKYLDDIQESK
jgi:hypothetical protein